MTKINHEHNVDEISRRLLKAIAGIEGQVDGAYNLRQNGTTAKRFSTQQVDIRPRQDGKPGIEVWVKPYTRQEQVHIPVVLTQPGLCETVYNDFIIGEGAQVNIVAGCAIHNRCGEKSQHDGVHTFNIGKGARVTYSEKHYGEGEEGGTRVLNPITQVYMQEDSFCDMEMVQMEGVSSTLRKTTAHLGPGAKLVMTERLLTHQDQQAVSNVDVFMDGDGSSAQIISRSVAKDQSRQEFRPVAVGNAACAAHIQCDSIIMDRASVKSMPGIEANHPNAAIVHEAAIGRIHSDQLIKLETLGLEQQEAEQVIIQAFLE